MDHVVIEGKIILSGCLVVNERREILLLYKKDHRHYEAPGGKVDLAECSNPDHPSIDDLARTAERELHEELGDAIRVERLEYFGNVSFRIPDGRYAVAHKFLTRITAGTPILAEPDIFLKFDYLPINRLGDYPISPDLRVLLPRLIEI